jgi:hypothetical protein
MLMMTPSYQKLRAISKNPPGKVPGKRKHMWRSSPIGLGLLIDQDNTLSVKGVFVLRAHVSIAMWFSGDGGNIQTGIFVGPCQLLLNWPTLIVVPSPPQFTEPAWTRYHALADGEKDIDAAVALRAEGLFIRQVALVKRWSGVRHKR